MNKVEINKTMKLSEHLASPSEAALSQTNELDGLRLSPHFTLEELCKTSYHTLDGNIPSRVAIENLSRGGTQKAAANLIARVSTGK